MTHQHLLLVAALAFSPFLAQGQSNTPNPLVRPQREAMMPAPMPGAQKDAPPRAVAISKSSQPATSPEIPSPSLINAGLPPLPASGKSDLAEVRELLALYTVTAVVGSQAIMRTNVGQSQTTQQGQSGSPPSAAAGNTQSASAKQLVIRVKTGLPISVAGVTLVPTVRVSEVDFRLTKDSASAAPIFTAVLDSASTSNYVPPGNLKELPDIGTPMRVAPKAIGVSQSGAPSSPGAPGAPGQR